MLQGIFYDKYTKRNNNFVIEHNNYRFRTRLCLFYNWEEVAVMALFLRMNLNICVGDIFFVRL